MKIRVRYFLLFTILFFSIGYVIGCLWPISALQVDLSSGPITKGDHWRNLFSLATALGSLAAVVVALFKEEIQGCFKSVSLEFNLGHEKAIEDIDVNGTEHPKAIRYRNFVTIKNTGNVNALTCEVFIDKITHIVPGDITPTSIKINNDKFSFGTRNSQVYIPAHGGTKAFDIFQITSSTMPSGESSPILMIGENTCNLPNSGTWTIECTISMTNAKPIPLAINLEWNGKWFDRINEMQIKTTIKKQ